MFLVRVFELQFWLRSNKVIEPPINALLELHAIKRTNACIA